MRFTLFSTGIIATMALAVSADISDIFDETLEKNSGVLDTVVNNQFAGSIVQAIPAAVPQQAQPASNRLTDAQIAAINQQLAEAASANYPQAIPATYPQVQPASYPQAIPASYRPVAPQNVQYIPYPVASKHGDDDDEEEEDEEEEDEEEEDEEEYDADDLVTRRRR